MKKPRRSISWKNEKTFMKKVASVGTSLITIHESSFKLAQDTSERPSNQQKINRLTSAALSLTTSTIAPSEAA